MNDLLSPADRHSESADKVAAYGGTYAQPLPLARRRAVCYGEEGGPTGTAEVAHT
jgi:hypothetical protein